MSEETKVEVSAEMEKFISYIENMTVLDLSILVKALEERLGVSAAAPVAVAAVAAPAAGTMRIPMAKITARIANASDHPQLGAP